MKEILLTKGYVALVDDADYDGLNAYRWYVSGNGYAQARINGKQVYMHRFILQTPSGYDTDHINGDKRDNRRKNLRIATRSQNCQNQKAKGAHSRFIGVTKFKQRNYERWMTAIRVDGKRIYLGYFIDEVDAARAYDVAARKYYGEFAKTNF